MTSSPDFGAFVISLDFELYWGVRDFLLSNDSYRKNLAGEYEAVPAMLKLFEDFKIAATWATVGFLFADSKAELEEFKPKILPEYEKPELSPYNEIFEEQADEASLHYAPKLINLVNSTARQEIATHTFSHYYCLEKGQTKEAFTADIESAVAIAKKNSINLKSIVFPRNQHNPEYDDVLLKYGIICYRGNQNSWMYQFDGKTQVNPIYRIARLGDTYLNLSGLNTFHWKDILTGEVANIPASMFLRPVSLKGAFWEDRQFDRITKSLEFAAKNNQIFHLWWHPHNFGLHLTENLSFLKRIFEVFQNLKENYGMKSLTMAETAETVLETSKQTAV
jgi:peptidoglycan/xylan/chitin deacetylase (PgdA/CDA1 family)